MRRFTGERMERVERSLRALATTDAKAKITARQVLDGVVAAYKTAVKNRPSHPSSHRLLAYGQLKAGRLADAFRTITAAVKMDFSGRFVAARQILQEDQAILASAWKRACPDMDVKALVNSILDASDTRAADEVFNHLHARTPTLRFVLNWETDANDVDFHIYDSKGGHAFFSAPGGAPPGLLYGDVTQGWGPECFAIAQKAKNFPYRVEAHYFRYAIDITVHMRVQSGVLS